MARFIGYPRGQVLAVFNSSTAAEAAVAGLAAAGTSGTSIERYEREADADRFDATGRRHGIVARILRATQFSLMDQLPAMAWYEAALREGKAVLAVRTADRAETLRVVEALRSAGGHFINRFGRLATEEFARWSGPDPQVSNVMRH